jgi:hypothetical protein
MAFDCGLSVASSGGTSTSSRIDSQSVGEFVLPLSLLGLFVLPSEVNAANWLLVSKAAWGATLGGRVGQVGVTCVPARVRPTLVTGVVVDCVASLAVWVCTASVWSRMVGRTEPRCVTTVKVPASSLLRWRLAAKSCCRSDHHVGSPGLGGGRGGGVFLAACTVLPGKRREEDVFVIGKRS